MPILTTTVIDSGGNPVQATMSARLTTPAGYGTSAFDAASRLIFGSHETSATGSPTTGIVQLMLPASSSIMAKSAYRVTVTAGDNQASHVIVMPDHDATLASLLTGQETPVLETGASILDLRDTPTAYGRRRSALIVRGETLVFENLGFTAHWDGHLSPDSPLLDTPATRAGITQSNPWLPDLDGVRYWNLADHHGLFWHRAGFDWSSAFVLLSLKQNQALWATTVFVGCSTGQASSDNHVRTASKGLAMWIGRPTVAAGSQGLLTDGWNFFVTVAGDESGSIDNPEAFNGAVADTASTKDHIEIASSVLDDGPHDILIIIRDRSVLLYVNGTKYGRWSLTSSQLAKMDGPFLGVTGDSGDEPTKTNHLYSFYAGVFTPGLLHP